RLTILKGGFNMKRIALMLLLSIIVGACHSQKKDKLSPLARLATADTSYKPKVDIKVNKQYDDKGNLIQFDSSYSYFYSSPGLKLDKSIRSDSLFGNMKSPLFNDYKNLFDENMHGIFFNDS